MLSISSEFRQIQISSFALEFTNSHVTTLLESVTSETFDSIGTSVS